MNLQTIENELKKLHVMPPWGRKQSDDWDNLSKFIYRCRCYEDFMTQLKTLNQTQEFENYVTHRWFNALSAYGIEQLFCTNSGVLANKNKYDKLVDFQIHGINFDHKTTVFPKGFGKDLNYAQQNPTELIHWLYTEQSKEGRFHTENRLFLVLHKSDGKHWQLRKELTLIKPLIDNYVLNFDSSNLYYLSLDPHKTTFADIIWVCI